MANPVVLKEALRASRGRHTFILRVALPVFAISMTAPRVIYSVSTSGLDRRTLSELVARPAFYTCAWMQMVVFALLGTFYTATGLREEWTRGTMDLLLSTPLTSRYILWGKLRGLVSFAIPLLSVPLLALLTSPAMKPSVSAPRSSSSVWVMRLKPVIVSVT